MSHHGGPHYYLFLKKDGTFILCIDYHQLNKLSVKNKNLLHQIDDLFDQVRGATIFSKIDLRNGYHQLQIKDEYIHKTTSITRYSHYEFIVLPFSLTNVKTTFMCLMNNVLHKYLDRFVLVFIDDILVYSKNEEEHKEHLKLVLQSLREHQLYPKLNKCEFYKDKMKYLGHIISKERLFVDLEKVRATMNWPIPKDVLAVRSFMEVAGYYQRFIV